MNEREVYCDDGFMFLNKTPHDVPGGIYIYIYEIMVGKINVNNKKE